MSAFGEISIEILCSFLNGVVCLVIELEELFIYSPVQVLVICRYSILWVIFSLTWLACSPKFFISM